MQSIKRIINNNKNTEIEEILDPNRHKSKCPAVILAANRTERVRGRIKFLTTSIKTMKGISTTGVPKGTKWASIELVVLNIPIIIWPTHKGKANLIVNTRCLEEVKIYGNKPMKLFKKIVNIIIIGINLISLWDHDLPKELISDKIDLLANLKVSKIKFELNQNRENKNKTTKILDNQFNEYPIKAWGLKIENKLDIRKINKGFNEKKS